jgi:short-subunit dehydrogenase
MTKLGKSEIMEYQPSAGSLVVGPSYKLPSATYGASKAAVHYVLKVLHNEHPDLISMPVCPG